MITDSLKIRNIAELCLGSAEEDFVEICKMKGGSMKSGKGSGETVAFIDNASFEKSYGKRQLETVRRVDCDLLCKQGGRYPPRCISCYSILSTLRSCCSRQRSSKSDNKVSSSSHKKYCALTFTDKDTRLKNLYRSLRCTRMQLTRMSAKAKNLVESDGVTSQPVDANDISAILRI